MMRGNGNPPTINDIEPASAEASRLLGDALSETPASSFRMLPSGLYWDPGQDKPLWFLSPPFQVVAQTRNADGMDWGLLLRWYDPDHVEHEWAMPYAALGGGAEEIWRTMLAGGLAITSTRPGREKLAHYLSTSDQAS
jgi:putative DNA primase/helicase